MQVEPYGPNPLVDGFAAKNPDLVKAALADGPAPQMFNVGGALPPFTASGIDPNFLMMLPWACRHYAAAATSAADVLNLIEMSGKDPDATADSEGLTDYVSRVAEWLAGPVNPSPFATRTTEQLASDEDMYTAMFGEIDAVTRAADDERRASEQAFFDMRDRTGPYMDGVGRAQR